MEERDRRSEAGPALPYRAVPCYSAYLHRPQPHLAAVEGGPRPARAHSATPALACRRWQDLALYRHTARVRRQHSLQAALDTIWIQHFLIWIETVDWLIRNLLHRYSDVLI